MHVFEVIITVLVTVSEREPITDIIQSTQFYIRRLNRAPHIGEPEDGRLCRLEWPHN